VARASSVQRSKRYDALLQTERPLLRAHAPNMPERERVLIAYALCSAAGGARSGYRSHGHRYSADTDAHVYDALLFLFYRRKRCF